MNHFDLFFYTNNSLNVSKHIEYLCQIGIKTFATTSLQKDILKVQKNSKILFYHVDGNFITYLHICFFMGMGKFIVLYFDKNLNQNQIFVDKIIQLMSVPYTNTKCYLCQDTALYYIVRKWKKKEFVFKKDQYNYKMKLLLPDSNIDNEIKLFDLFFYLGQCHLKNEQPHMLKRLIFKENLNETGLLINHFTF